MYIIGIVYIDEDIVIVVIIIGLVNLDERFAEEEKRPTP